MCDLTNRKSAILPALHQMHANNIAMEAYASLLNAMQRVATNIVFMGVAT